MKEWLFIAPYKIIFPSIQSTNFKRNQQQQQQQQYNNNNNYYYYYYY